MSLASVFVLFYTAIFVTTVILITYAIPYRKLLSVKLMMGLVASFSIISFCALNVYISDSFEAKVLFSRLRFIGFSVLAPCWLLFVVTAFNRFNFIKNKYFVCLLFSVPAVTIVLTLVPSLRDLHVTNFEAFSAHGLSVVKFQGGPWFPIHVWWAWSVVLSSILLSIWIFIKEEGDKRKQVFALMLGGVLGTLVDAYCVYTDSPFRWLMLSGATYILSEAAIFYAIFKYRLLDIAHIAMEKVFRDFPDPVLVLDSRECLQAINLSAIKIFDISKQQIGLSLSELFPNFLISEGNEVPLVDRMGKERVFSLKIDALKNDRGVITGKIVFFRDITIQKAIEKSLHESLEFKTRLMTLIAHDMYGNIKNQAILSSSLRDKVQSEVKDVATMLTDSVFASQDLISNILAWAKLQQTSFVPIKRPFEMNTLLFEAADTLKTSLQLKGVDIEINSQEKPLIITGDSEMLSSIIRNLISNAIRASEKGRKILIDLEITAKELLLSVQDEGVGMTPSHVSSVLNTASDSMFKPEHSSEGYGIGLAITKRFIELHGGNLQIDSELGVGTRVSFSIPL